MPSCWSLKLQRLHVAQETWNDDQKNGEINTYMSLILPGVGDIWGELVVIDWFAVETKKALEIFQLGLNYSTYGDVKHYGQKESLVVPS